MEGRQKMISSLIVAKEDNQLLDRQGVFVIGGKKLWSGEKGETFFIKNGYKGK